MGYPNIEPYASGFLDVGDGHLLSWEACGNPEGRPAVVLHGGPGSGRGSRTRRYFDPAAYRIIRFDQRGCGASTPSAADHAADLSTNTTWHLLGDLEALRMHLDVDRWLVFGASWGTTLGLLYAEHFPQHVRALVLAGVTTTRQSEIDWLYRGLAPMLPAQWEAFQQGVAAAARDGDLVAAYHELRNSPDPAIRAAAARDWHAWDTASSSALPATTPAPADPRMVLARARIVTHYFRHRAWLEDGVILANADRLAGIPGVMIQGNLDLKAPLVTASELSKLWSDSELILVPNAGHSTEDTGMTDAIVAATDRFARLPDASPCR
jgi:proline iminopeptidase